MNLNSCRRRHSLSLVRRGAGGDHFDAKWHFLEASKIKLSEEIDYTRTKPEEVVKSESTSDNPQKQGEERHAIPITDL